MTAAGESRLLAPDEPDPVGVMNPDSGETPWLFICEHAASRIPASLGRLGLSREDVDRHIGWDIGILELTKAVAGQLGAPLYYQRYSRLVIDCNRPLDSGDLIPWISERTAIPGNRDLTPAARERRMKEIWQPFQDAVAAHLKPRGACLVMAMHSFTPVFKGDSRPWHVGLLYNRFPDAALGLKQILQRIDKGLNIGLNRPYTVSDDDDYTVPVHGEQTGCPHVLVEIRQDLIDTPEKRIPWITRMTSACRELAQTLNLVKRKKP